MIKDYKTNLVKSPDTVKFFQLINGDIESIDLGKYKGDIPFYMFYNCQNLKEIILPKESANTSGNRIKDNAFSGCVSLERILIPGNFTVIENYAFTRCTGLKEVIIENVEELISDVFYNCTSLESITLPGNLKLIMSLAFRQCYSLSNITFNGTIEQWNNVQKSSGWNDDIPATYVQCTDGQVTL